MQKTFPAADVSIREVPATPVAIMEHRGDPETLGATIQRFITWRKAAGYIPDEPNFQRLALRTAPSLGCRVQRGSLRSHRSADR